MRSNNTETQRFPIGYGARFESRWVKCSNIAKKSIAVQVPWEGGVIGKVGGQYILKIPQQRNPELLFSIGLPNGSPPSLKIQFIVKIEGDEIFTRVYNELKWKEYRISLREYVGKEIKLQLVADSSGDSGRYWAAWGEPQVRADKALVFDLVDLADADKVSKYVVLVYDPKIPYPPKGTDLLLNQVGYELYGPKRIVVQSSSRKAAGSFCVLSQPNKQVVYEGKLTPMPSIESWGSKWVRRCYWIGDFSSICTPGTYLLKINLPEGERAETFEVGKEILFKKTAPIVGPFFLRQRLNLDDGGWKSDCVSHQRHVLFATSTALYGLINCYEAKPQLGEQFNIFYSEEHKQDNNEVPKIIDDIRWGLKGLLNLQKSNGKFQGSGREGRDHCYAGMGIAVLARLARAQYMTEEKRRLCLSAARNAYNFYEKFEPEKILEPGWGWSPVYYGLEILADLEMFQTTGERNYLKHAQWMALQTLKHWPPNTPDEMWGPRLWQEGVPAACLGKFVQFCPKEVPLQVVDVLKQWLEDSVINPDYGMNSNAFGIRKWDGEHFFNPNRWKGHEWYIGENNRYITTAWAALIGYRVFRRPEFYELAYNHINWICGIMPIGRCMISGVGKRPWIKHYGTIGSSIGAIPNGPVSTGPAADIRNKVNGLLYQVLDDTPVFDLRWETHEPWTPYNGYWLLMLVETLRQPEFL